MVDFAIPADHRMKIKEIKKRDKYIDLVWEVKKHTLEQESYSDSYCNWCTRYNPQKNWWRAWKTWK